MCSSCRRRLNVVLALQVALAAACLFATSAAAQTTRPGVLVVVAEPNNLPFSNDREEGFENKLAQLVAREMNVKLEYRWRAMRRGYFRETIKSGQADLVLGVPRNLDMALPTEPYYRSSYVFVTRDGSPKIESFLGLHLIYILTAIGEFGLMAAFAIRHSFEDKHGLDVTLMGGFWYWLAGIWLVTYVIVYWYPRWS